jgi:REP element-mobilizing transposase RayT
MGGIMARPLRLESPGNYYHVTVRGDRKERIFESDADRISLLQLINEAASLHHWHLLAYCLMDNHYHLEVETPLANLAAGMRRINGAYTQRYNARYERVGHVFQGRYKALPLLTDQHLLGACRYIVRNPLRAGLVKDPAEWQWSSYRASAQLAPGISGCDAAWIRTAVADGDPERYCSWVMAGLDESCDYLHPARKTPGRQTGQPAQSAQTCSPEKAWQPPVVPVIQPLGEILKGCAWRGRGTTDDLQLRLRVREALDAGYSQRAIAVALGTTHVTIRTLLKPLGLADMGSAGNERPKW